MTAISRIVADQPRSCGHVQMSVLARDAGSRLARLRQEGSLRVLFPRVAGAVPQAVLVNTSGGVTGGDEFAVKVEIGAGAALTVTTQAAERAYRAQPGQDASIGNRVVLGIGGHLNWLPQETILFDGCSLRRQLVVELAPGASALIVEPLVFGRHAMGERLSSAMISDRIEVRRDGRPVLVDRFQFRGDIAAQLATPATAHGAGAMATLVFAHPDAPAHLDHVRAQLPETAGASLVRDDLLVARLLAGDSHLLRQTLMPLLTRLGNDDLPRPWMI